MSLLLQVLWFLVGVVLLTGGAEGLVRGGVRIANALRVSPLVVGLTLVSFGTSAPELAVSIQAAQRGSADLAVGNVVGSNIFNVLAVLGAGALVRPLVVEAQVVRREIPVMILVSLLLWPLAWNGRLGTVEGAILFTGIIGYTIFLYRESRQASEATAAEYEEAYGTPTPASLVLAALMVIGGIGLLVLGGGFIIDSTTQIARFFGVSELVIGLTLVAGGTSLPELATTLVAVARGEDDIAVGNAVGSCVFNILCILGVTSLLAPLTVSPQIMAFDLPIMTVTAVVTLLVVRRDHRVTRLEGALLIAGYVSYLALLAWFGQAGQA